MTRPICLQVYISSELSSLIRKAAKAKGISMSEWVRALLAHAAAHPVKGEACDEEAHIHHRVEHREREAALLCR